MKQPKKRYHVILFFLYTEGSVSLFRLTNDYGYFFSRIILQVNVHGLIVFVHTFVVCILHQRK